VFVRGPDLVHYVINRQTMEKRPEKSRAREES
jgi:hypothetical protein